MSVDKSIWELYNWYFKEIKDPTSYKGADDEDYGDIKLWIGIYHTKQIEPNNRDVFMVIYRGATVPQKSKNKEQGYTNIFRVKSNIDQYVNSNQDYYLIDYGPINKNSGKKYIISTTQGVTSDGPEFSMTLSEEIILRKMYIISETNDPNYYTEFNYVNERNNYSKSEQYHYGFMVIDTPANDFHIKLNLYAEFTDWDTSLFKSREWAFFGTNFEFDSNR